MQMVILEFQLSTTRWSITHSQLDNYALLQIPIKAFLVSSTLWFVS